MSSDDLLSAEKALRRISKSQYEQLIELFHSIPRLGAKSTQLERYIRKLYELGIIIPFDWGGWTKGKEDVLNSEFEFTNCSLLDIAKYLTLIIRADRFNEGLLESTLKMGHFDKLMDSLTNRVRELD